MPVEIGANGIDIAYSGTQKCLSAPPGLAPLTLSDKTLERLRSTESECVSWYLDLKLIDEYWGTSHRYHHTTPITMFYALREALRLCHQETLEARFTRHRRNHLAFVAGIEAMGLEMHVAPENRPWTLQTPRLPDGCNDGELREYLLTSFGIEVLGGFGPLAGKVLRIGLMGASSQRQYVLLLLGALGSYLGSHGGVAAAEAIYEQPASQASLS